MAKSLLVTFSDLDVSIRDTLADIQSPLLLSFAALDIAANEAQTERLTAEHIVACLESAGVAVRKTSVSRALARAGDRVSTRKNLYGETEYKLMTRGRREIENLVGGELMSVLLIDAGKPRAARLRLGETLQQLRGTIRICDPYYGVKMLDTLDHLPANAAIRVLTARTNESARKVSGALRDFKRERPSAEFRITANPDDIHDRYVLSQRRLLILGHGLKDIGGKESFIIQVDRQLAPDLLQEVRSRFDARWRQGTVL